jgi:acetolactate synthase-1/2/3 large subunit
MMKLSDYVIRYLADYGVRHIFMVTGGGAMHLNDSIGKESRIQYICNHHEQACAMAAEGYARVSGKIGVICVTTGPGGINALNGVFGAWTDSIPMLIISGQVKRETCMAFNSVPGLRQLGDQEADIISMVKGITKYAVLIRERASIRYHLEKALYLATSGRPGPCWLDIPIDIQAALINPETLPGYVRETTIIRNHEILAQHCREVIQKLKECSRPVILAGSGIRCSLALDIFQRVIRKIEAPVTTAWTHDLISTDDSLYCGRPGTIGDRAGNFVVQNADLLIVLGSRLNIRQVSYNWEKFAPKAYNIQVDIDESEFRKPTVCPDLAIQADLKEFLDEFDKLLDDETLKSLHRPVWLSWCQERRNQYPVVNQERLDLKGLLNPYVFVDALFYLMDRNDVIVCGNGAACVVTFQAAKIKMGQRLFSNSGGASMGYDLPAAIGAATAHAPCRVICIAGDGSIQMNIQELQTIAHHSLPIKIFVLNNGGYLSIRTTQKTFLGNLVGEGPSSGVSFPDMVAIANAYGIKAQRLDNYPIEPALRMALESEGPFLMELVLDPDKEMTPRLKSRSRPDGTIVSPSLEDMYPFLSQEELHSNMWRNTNE